MGKMVKVESLPRNLQDPTVGGCASDAGNLLEVLEAATTCMQRLSSFPDEQRAARNSLASLLWLATDLVDALKWKLERIEEEQARVS